MALIACKECKKEISTEATICPSCGVKKPSGKFGLSEYIVLFVVIIVLLISLSNFPKSNVNDSLSESVSASKIDPLPVENHWQYETRMDEVSGKPLLDIHIQSNNVFELEFPYTGGTTSFLTIRKHPRYGKDVIVQISKGQLSCQYNNCYISIRFDDGEVIKHKVDEPSDNSNQSYFLRNTNKLIKNIQKSKKMYVELIFYQQGSRTFEFNTENLDLTKIK